MLPSSMRQITTNKDEQGIPLTYSFYISLGEDIPHIKREYNNRTTANKYYDLFNGVNQIYKEVQK